MIRMVAVLLGGAFSTGLISMGIAVALKFMASGKTPDDFMFTGILVILISVLALIGGVAVFFLWKGATP